MLLLGSSQWLGLQFREVPNAEGNWKPNQHHVHYQPQYQVTILIGSLRV